MNIILVLLLFTTILLLLITISYQTGCIRIACQNIKTNSLNWIPSLWKFRADRQPCLINKHTACSTYDPWPGSGSSKLVFCSGFNTLTRTAPYTTQLCNYLIIQLLWSTNYFYRNLMEYRKCWLGYARNANYSGQQPRIRAVSIVLFVLNLLKQ